jgi:hypothetical protein
MRPRLADSPLRPDFYFSVSSGPVCVFCDDTPPLPEALDQRAELEDGGYQVLQVGPDDDLDAVIARLRAMR